MAWFEKRKRKLKKDGKDYGDFVETRQIKFVNDYDDEEILKLTQIGCGKCEECRIAKANEWRVRLMEEIKSNPKNIIFATLTFSEESLKKLEYDEKEPNKAPQKAITLFRKRWWKKYKAPLKHWLVTELGHDNTKRIHLHGIIWTELTEEQFEKEWGYGWIFFEIGRASCRERV